MIPMAQPSGQVFYLDFVYNMTYRGPIWIGKDSSNIRLWLDEVRDDDSYQILSDAAKKFVETVAVNPFYISFINDEKNLQVIKSRLNRVEALNPMDNKHWYSVNFTFSSDTNLDKFVATEVANYGYFYFTGQIECHDEDGQSYDTKEKVFRPITKHIVDSAEFTALYFYYERKLDNIPEHQLLLPAIPQAAKIINAYDLSDTP